MANLYHSLFALKLLSLLGCGLVAGVFFAFSTFVMPALARLQPMQGLAAMQAINIAAINPLFMTAIFGTAAICIFLVCSSLLKWNQPGSAYLLLGSLCYLIGAVLVTFAFNVPLNDALAKVDPESINGANLWAKYLNDWTFWNHVRTIASLAAAALFAIGLSK
ncbi:MAG: DUF1772 domain-containing protein [Oscillatoriales cyanobacterium RU_3_3]|nr:DUF1772 domain-containing protein [Microcoleus sp. SU_5_6]NJL66630.1 DUF1772 domain-containing protein [Microcoleus sp. SM1_3_4]NJM60267.1 DUF1772 domain-containing protein [Oscillatoriales cyanobacterium RU_3_3]NJR25178.1 DUF1772 domain-containing protein [Richelia sp. CSU_2_1]